MLHIQDHEKASKPYILPDRHTQLDNFGVAEFRPQPAEKLSDAARGGITW